MRSMGKRAVAKFADGLPVLLTQRCTIEREAAAVGQMGEPLHGWAVVASNVPCLLISRNRGRESAYEPVGAQKSLVEYYRVAFPIGTDFATDDRILLDGSVYLVTDVVEWGRPVMVQAVVQKIRGEVA